MGGCKNKIFRPAPPPRNSRRLPPLAHQDRQDHLQIRPRAAKMAPRGPKSNQEPPKSHPRAAEDHQIATQEPQRATKNHQNRVLAPARSTFSNMSDLIFRLHLQPPKSDPRGPKGVLRLHQSRPRPPKSDPSEPQERSRSFQRAPYDLLKSHLDPVRPSKTDPRSPKSVPDTPRASQEHPKTRQAPRCC